MSNVKGGGESNDLKITHKKVQQGPNVARQEGDIQCGGHSYMRKVLSAADIIPKDDTTKYANRIQPVQIRSRALL